MIEACVENIHDAIKAQTRGANRIELCQNLLVGGTTPSAGTIAIATQMLRIPVKVLIRPRGGDFVYSATEVKEMLYDIAFCRQMGVSGVVTGALRKDGTIDTDLTHQFVQAARPMQLTFHKAIDETPDMLGEFRKLMDIGIDSVLTSGGCNTAIEGKSMINDLYTLANGKVKIIAAGKIVYTDLEMLQPVLLTDEFHGQKITGSLKG